MREAFKNIQEGVIVGGQHITVDKAVLASTKKGLQKIDDKFRQCS